jgi:SAM-dependent methyltransferase
MSEVTEHYERLLAEHYTWMFGAPFAELADEQARLLMELGAADTASRSLALDLGAGSGFQSFALAILGFQEVVALDTSEALLDELGSRNTQALPIRVVRADMSDGLADVVGDEMADLAVCMGDTLTHLGSYAAVHDLFTSVSRALVPGGRFILTFRDLTAPLVGLDRFLPVHADDHALMLCFIEEQDASIVRVHDLLHVREPNGSWTFAKSSYPKLRLSPAWVADSLRSVGFRVERRTTAPRRMCAICAVWPG